jgi:hypothetical protein
MRRVVIESRALLRIPNSRQKEHDLPYYCPVEAIHAERTHRT